ncbi:uncharacterized protein LOC143876169 [Tasmannia lanceolata]|uniref:uncharacterized protein LOC143876169 n=1 Tax=Tasmannia lanceolata TaxID=3420 RepID=UPI004062A572
MFRQTSSRNQKTRGFRVKHALQIALLVAVCIWLLYQVKHSYDKRKAFQASNANISDKVEGSHEILKLGRKDLNRVVEVVSVDDKHGEEEENEEEESKQDEIEDEGRGGGDDEIDAHDQENAEEETEHREDFANEEEGENDENKESKEREEMERNEENEEKDENEENLEKVKEENEENMEKEKEENEENKENDAQNEDAGSVGNLDHDGNRNSNEAREAQYNGDDASSAVVKDTLLLRSESGNEVSGNSDGDQVENTEKHELDNDNKTNAAEDGHVDQNESTNPNSGELPTVSGDSETVYNTSLNATDSEESGAVISLSKLENESLPNSTMTESNSQTEFHNNATLENTENPDSSLQNGTTTLDSTQDQDATVNIENSDQENPNAQTVGLEQTEGTNTTDGVEESDVKSVSTLDTNADGDAAQNETTDPFTSQVAQEVKDALTDLETLPTTESEVKNAENVAAE